MGPTPIRVKFGGKVIFNGLNLKRGMINLVGFERI